MQLVILLPVFKARQVTLDLYHVVVGTQFLQGVLQLFNFPIETKNSQSAGHPISLHKIIDCLLLQLIDFGAFQAEPIGQRYIVVVAGQTA